MLKDITSWLNQPIIGQVDTVHLFLLTGVVIAAAILWNLILMHVRLAAEELI